MTIGKLYINVPHMLMREQPTYLSTVVSDTSYSEEIKILEEQPSWVRVETVIDKYQGWIPKVIFNEADGKPRNVYHETKETIFQARINNCFHAHLYRIKDTEQGPIRTLPFESRIMNIEDASDNRWLKVKLLDGEIAYIQRGDVDLTPQKITVDQMIALSKKFINLSYSWGGKSSFGYDCSGFIQMLFRQREIFLPRDSKDQSTWDGFDCVELKDLQAGDLVFFGLTEEKIRHVCLYLGDNTVIHSTVRENMPYVHINKLSDSEWNGSGTYPFRVGRRLREPQ